MDAEGEVAGRESGIVNLFIASVNPSREIDGEEKEKQAVEQVEVGEGHGDSVGIEFVACAGRAQHAVLTCAANVCRRNLIGHGEVAAEERRYAAGG